VPPPVPPVVVLTTVYCVSMRNVWEKEYRPSISICKKEGTPAIPGAECIHDWGNSKALSRASGTESTKGITTLLIIVQPTQCVWGSLHVGLEAKTPATKKTRSGRSAAQQATKVRRILTHLIPHHATEEGGAAGAYAPRRVPDMSSVLGQNPRGLDIGALQGLPDLLSCDSPHSSGHVPLPSLRRLMTASGNLQN
jgi:hypothetical protein